MFFLAYSAASSDCSIANTVAELSRESDIAIAPEPVPTSTALPGVGRELR